MDNEQIVQAWKDVVSKNTQQSLKPETPAMVLPSKPPEDGSDAAILQN